MLIETESKAREVISFLRTCDAIVMDTETNGLDWHRDHLVGVAMRAKGQSFYFPFRHGEGYNLPLPYLADVMGVLNDCPLQTGYHYRFDIHMARKDGLRLPQRIEDPMLWAHMANENEPSFKLESLGAKYLKIDAETPERELLAKLEAKFGKPKRGGKPKSNLWRLPASDVAPYACQDVETTEMLREFYRRELAKWYPTLMDRICEFQLVLIDIERRGMRLDFAKLDELEAMAAPKAEEYAALIQEAARADMGIPDFPANPRSHPQMGAWLKSRLGIPDTAKKTLQLVDDPRGNMLLQHRLYDKLVGTFIRPYRAMAVEGRLHAQLQICTPGNRGSSGDDGVGGTISGRLSSKKPNLQQVPSVVRAAFIADEGHELAELDYSQAELRVAAHYWWEQFGDRSLANVLLAGEDMHQTAANAAGITRKAAKNRNFAIQYGAGAAKLALMTGSTEAAEKRYIATFNRTFPGRAKFMHATTAQAKRRGYVRMWNGRTRRFNCQQAKEKDAANNIIQGGVGQLLMEAMIECNKRVPEAKQIMTVHDCIVFQIPLGRRDLIDDLREIMQTAPWCRLPMIVDAKVGPRWGEMEELPRTRRGISPEVLAYTTDPTLAPSE